MLGDKGVERSKIMEAELFMHISFDVGIQFAAPNAINLFGGHGFC